MAWGIHHHYGSGWPSKAMAAMRHRRVEVDHVAGLQDMLLHSNLPFDSACQNVKQLFAVVLEAYKLIYLRGKGKKEWLKGSSFGGIHQGIAVVPEGASSHYGAALLSVPYGASSAPVGRHAGALKQAGGFNARYVSNPSKRTDLGNQRTMQSAPN